MQLSDKKRSRLAAGFAISNLGLGQFMPADIAVPHRHWSTTPNGAVCDLAGHLMESDEHEKIFTDEAEMWANTLDEYQEEDLLRIHGTYSPWIKQILDVPDEKLK